METFPGQVYVAFGAVLAAVIAGAFSYFNLVSAKESKVSEFRQAWIDALRTEITTYISRLMAVSNLGAYIDENFAEDNKDDVELLRERSRLYEEALSAYHAIQLRVNKDETDPVAKDLNDKFLAALQDAHVWFKVGLHEVLEDNLTTLSDAASPLLKYEWDRVKQGEPNYRHAKAWALLIACSSLPLLLIALAGIFWQPLQSKASASVKARAAIQTPTTPPSSVPAVPATPPVAAPSATGKAPAQ
jgi:hypothetical protein